MEICRDHYDFQLVYINTLNNETCFAHKSNVMAHTLGLKLHCDTIFVYEVVKIYSNVLESSKVVNY